MIENVTYAQLEHFLLSLGFKRSRARGAMCTLSTKRPGQGWLSKTTTLKKPCIRQSSWPSVERCIMQAWWIVMNLKNG